MARRREDPAAMVERGKRLTKIREALGISQRELIPMLNAAARRLGLPANFETWTVSRNESGTISFEDAAVWLSLAPKEMKASWEWFVFGPPRQRGALLDDPRKATGRDGDGRKEA